MPRNLFFCIPVEFLTAVTHKSPTVWSCIIDHQKAERVSYSNGIWGFRSFGQSEAQNLRSVQPPFCPEQNPAAKSIFEIL
jgi:hypothetical protein